MCVSRSGASNLATLQEGYSTVNFFCLSLKCHNFRRCRVRRMSSIVYAETVPLNYSSKFFRTEAVKDRVTHAAARNGIMFFGTEGKKNETIITTIIVMIERDRIIRARTKHHHQPTSQWAHFGAKTRGATQKHSVYANCLPSCILPGFSINVSFPSGSPEQRKISRKNSI